MAATLKQEKDLLINYLYQETPENSDYANRSDFFLFSLLLKSNKLNGREEERRSKLQDEVLPHLKDRLNQNQENENGLMLYLFLNSLTPEEKKSFESSFSKISQQNTQIKQSLNDISQSNLANPQIYEGWGFEFRETKLIQEGEDYFIEVEVTQVFEGSKLKDQGVNVGDKIRVKITEVKSKSIDPIDTGKVAGLIRGAEQILVKKEGEDAKEGKDAVKINKEVKGIFALDEKGKHTSFENLSEERVKKCFTEAKQEVYKAQSPGTSPKPTIDPNSTSKKSWGENVANLLFAAGELFMH